MKRPIFIVGANRSGTTLLRLLLNAHSKIAIPDEINYFYGFDPAEVSFENWEAPPFTSDEYARFVDRFLKDNRSTVPGLDLDDVRKEILDGPMNLRRPYRVLLERWAEQHGKSRWGEKTPGNIYHANILIDMFPDAHFIHLVRDPRAGVESMRRVSFFSDDIVFNALNRHKIMTHGRSWLKQNVPADQHIEMRYEDLVTAPEKTLKDVCDFLKITYEPGMLNFHVDAERYMIEEAASSFNQAATQPISEERIDKWQNRLNDDEIATIELVCQEEMEEFGYTPLQKRISWGHLLTLTIKRLYWWTQWWRNRDDRHFAVLSPMFARTRERLRRATAMVSEPLARIVSADR